MTGFWTIVLLWLGLIGFLAWGLLRGLRLQRAVATGRVPPRYPVTTDLPSSNLVPFFAISIAWVGIVVTFVFSMSTVLDALEPRLPGLVAFLSLEWVIIAIIVGWLLVWGLALLWGIPLLHAALAFGYLELGERGLRIVASGSERFRLDWDRPWRLEQLYFRRVVHDDEGDRTDLFYPVYSLSQDGRTARLVFAQVAHEPKNQKEIEPRGPDRYHLRLALDDRRLGSAIRKQAREQQKRREAGQAGEGT